MVVSGRLYVYGVALSYWLVVSCHWPCRCRWNAGNSFCPTQQTTACILKISVEDARAQCTLAQCTHQSHTTHSMHFLFAAITSGKCTTRFCMSWEQCYRHRRCIHALAHSTWNCNNNDAITIAITFYMHFMRSIQMIRYFCQTSTARSVSSSGGRRRLPTRGENKTHSVIMQCRYNKPTQWMHQMRQQ